MKNRLKNNIKLVVIILLCSIFIGVLFKDVIQKLMNYPQLPDVYIALGTLALAFATALLAMFTFFSIKSGYDREKRDRKERLLNEIIEWAKEAAKAAISRRSRYDTELWDTKLKYKYSVAVSVYITEVVTNSFKELSPCVNKVIKELNRAITVTENAIKKCEQRLNTYHLCDTRSVVKQEGKLSDAVKELLKAIASTNY